MPQIDLFNFFRIWLGWIVTIYATIITVQSLWGWYVWLAGSDKYMSLLRRYVVLQGLRLRFRHTSPQNAQAVCRKLPRTCASMSSTADFAAASFCASRERTTMLVFGRPSSWNG